MQRKNATAKVSIKRNPPAHRQDIRNRRWPRPRDRDRQGADRRSNARFITPSRKGGDSSGTVGLTLPRRPQILSKPPLFIHPLRRAPKSTIHGHRRNLRPPIFVTALRPNRLASLECN